ncbi:ComEC/Rec2 family competence protein [Hankyongella ginsenosidimutans]|uniref:ComEC/Rec2 family competence protein n=1 Tax=Hankyongella ginsenosidimutans TaxID=1763828 RepID=A0A4D7C4Y4_9SPHN|nr:ComEC/Rec2 family competence protein [Hankyongella ginsenosidimutans]
MGWAALAGQGDCHPGLGNCSACLYLAQRRELADCARLSCDPGRAAGNAGRTAGDFLRVIAAAATLILVLRPEAVVNPSFQLSFAAVTALVAASQSRIAQRWLSRRPEDGTLQHLLRAAGLLILTGLAVEAMLAPIVIRHFNQTSLYGVAANLFAIPFTGMVIMPTLGVALLLEPLGLAMPFWRLCEAAILALLRLADWVSQLPGAVIHLPTPPLGAATLLVFALFWAILWRSRVRILAAVMVVIALSAMAMARRPVGFVDGEGRVVGVWRADGDLMVSSVRSGRYASTLWAEDLAARRIVWLGTPAGIARRNGAASPCRGGPPGAAGSCCMYERFCHAATCSRCAPMPTGSSPPAGCRAGAGRGSSVWTCLPCKEKAAFCFWMPALAGYASRRP